MELAGINVPVRHLGATAFCVLVVGSGAAAALADPPAQTHDYYAQARPDDRGGIRGVNAPSVLAGPSRATVAVRPDDRGGVRGVNGLSSTAASPSKSFAVRPDDRGGVRGIATTAVAASALAVGANAGFDWDAAGIGAGSMLGVLLIGASLLVVLVRHRAHRSRESAPALHV